MKPVIPNQVLKIHRGCDAVVLKKRIVNDKATVKDSGITVNAVRKIGVHYIQIPGEKCDIFRAALELPLSRQTVQQFYIFVPVGRTVVMNHRKFPVKDKGQKGIFPFVCFVNIILHRISCYSKIVSKDVNIDGCSKANIV
jgi:hypothetical protein